MNYQQRAMTTMPGKPARMYTTSADIRYCYRTLGNQKSRERCVESLQQAMRPGDYSRCKRDLLEGIDVAPGAEDMLIVDEESCAEYTACMHRDHGTSDLLYEGQKDACLSSLTRNNAVALRTIKASWHKFKHTPHTNADD